MSRIGSYIKFTAHPGQRDALVEHLLAAANSVSSLAGCELYIINTPPTEPDVVWVTEVWSSPADRDAPLTAEGASASIQQVLSLLAAPPERIDVLPIGGKGLIRK